MNEVDNKKIIDLHTEGKKRFRIIGIPERVIVDNKISYKIPVKIIGNDDIEENMVKYLSVTEEEMLEMLNLAKGYFSDEEANRAYT